MWMKPNQIAISQRACAGQRVPERNALRGPGGCSHDLHILKDDIGTWQRYVMTRIPAP